MEYTVSNEDVEDSDESVACARGTIKDIVYKAIKKGISRKIKEQIEKGLMVEIREGTARYSIRI